MTSAVYSALFDVLTAALPNAIHGLSIKPENGGAAPTAFYVEFNQGPVSLNTDTLEGGYTETFVVQLDAVVPAGNYTANSRAVVDWLRDTLKAGLRIGPAIVRTRPEVGPPDETDPAEFRVPVTVYFLNVSKGI